MLSVGYTQTTYNQYKTKILPSESTVFWSAWQNEAAITPLMKKTSLCRLCPKRWYAGSSTAAIYDFLAGAGLALAVSSLSSSSSFLAPRVRYFLDRPRVALCASTCPALLGRYQNWTRFGGCDRMSSTSCGTLFLPPCTTWGCRWYRAKAWNMCLFPRAGFVSCVCHVLWTPLRLIGRRGCRCVSVASLRLLEFLCTSWREIRIQTPES